MDLSKIGTPEVNLFLEVAGIFSRGWICGQV